jgi:hypothetical protein
MGFAGAARALACVSNAERSVIGKAAATVKRRLDAILAALPRASALQQGFVEDDPEHQIEPAAWRARPRARWLTAQ